MAKTAYDEVELRLQDGEEVTLKPLNIGRLKKFMAAWKGFQTVDLEKNEEAAFDVYITCAGIALQKELEHKFAENVNRQGELSEDYREYLEDTLDMDTIFKVLEVCGGLKLNDPNLLRAVAEAQAGKS